MVCSALLCSRVSQRAISVISSGCDASEALGLKGRGPCQVARQGMGLWMRQLKGTDDGRVDGDREWDR